jgi:hypothetical protein
MWWQAVLNWLTNYESLAIWSEGIALVAIFLLDWREYRRQGKDREEQHKETLEQMKIMERQMLATEMATKAAETSASAQQAAMQQWLIFQNWSTKEDISDPKGRFAIEIGFEIVNPTKLPLTMLSTKVRLLHQEAWRIHNILLSPNLPCALKLSNVVLNEEEATVYKSGGTLAFVVYGIVDFRDCFERKREQEFTGLLFFSKDKAQFTSEWFPDNPLRTKEETSRGQSRG